MTEPQPQPEWSLEHDVAYKIARDSIGYVIGMCSAALHEEEGKDSPNPDRLAFLNLRMQQSAELRRDLRYHDAASIADVNRDFGAIIRADRAEWEKREAAKHLEEHMLEGASRMTTDEELRREVAKRIS